jgi:signal transduction histidine kinase
MTMPLKNIPIQRKLMVIIMMTTVAALALMQSVFFVFEYFTFREATLRQLSTAGEVIAANSTAALAFDNQDDARETLGALKAEPHVIAGALYDEDGGLFAKYPADLPAASLPTVPGTPGYHFQKLFLTVFQPVVQGNRQLGTLYLKLDTGPTMKLWLKNSAATALVVIAIALVVAYLISRVLQKQISQPILSLAAAARRITEHRDYSVRATKLGNDELGLLTDSFNQMLAQIQNFNAMLERRVQERTAQLEAANKELEAFSYSVSHDLRAPLRHVDGFAEILRNDASAGLSDTGRRHLQIISESARRMGTLIDDLLVFSRMGRSEIRRTVVNNDELVAEVLQEMSGDLQNRNIKWEIGPLPEVTADRAMLKQVWVNLLSNAVKYSRPRAEALIQVRCRKNEQAQWEFSVQDNGAGFNMEYAGKLFGVFQRLHHADEFEGTGIGLANVRRIILRHEGTTWAQGEIDKGATFYFTLPVAEEAKHENNGSNSTG